MNKGLEQEIFWSKEYADEYISKNEDFNIEKGIRGWELMLSKAKGIHNILECGCNIGRNMKFLELVLPDAEKSIIELSETAYQRVTSNFKLEHSFNGSILESNLPKNSFNLVFSMGVLIHISPDILLDNMAKMYSYSNKYILIGEYFSRSPVMIEYQGQKNKLFKQDFGKLFIENFNVSIIDYGFLWGYEFDDAGFDDITWWLFKK